MSSQLRAVNVLRLLVNSPAPLTLKQISASLELSRTSAFRLLNALAHEGWVTGTGRPRRYSAGMAVAGLGMRAPHYRNLRGRLLPYLLDLAEELPSVISLAFYQNGQTLVSDGAERSGGRLLIHLGGDVFPACCTSGGKILLAYQTEAEIARACGAPLPRFTEKTRWTVGEMRAEIERAGKQGYGTSDEERYRHTSGLAVPVFDSSGGAVAAIGVTRAGSLNEAWVLETLGPAQRVAQRASFDLGYRPGQAKVLVS